MHFAMLRFCKISSFFFILTAYSLSEGASRDEYLINGHRSLMIRLSFDVSTRQLLDCKVYRTQKSIYDELSDKHNLTSAHFIEKDLLSILAGLCEKFSSTFNSIAQLGSNSIVFPGTKWCGIGSVAGRYGDLGLNQESDKCCRAHDFCPDVIEAGETKHGIQNGGIGTISHCHCDDQFHKCLKRSGDSSSRMIGVFFYNVFKMPCFKMEHPIIKCMQFYGKSNPTCRRYKFDITQPKLYQMFDPVHFYN